MLYQINFKYVNEKFLLRNGATVVEAKDQDEAIKKADANLKHTSVNSPKIISVRPY